MKRGLAIIVLYSVFLLACFGEGTDCPVTTTPSLGCTVVSGLQYSCTFSLPLEVTTTLNSFVVSLFVHPNAEIDVDQNLVITAGAYTTCATLNVTASSVTYRLTCSGGNVLRASSTYNFTEYADLGEITGQQLDGTFTLTTSASATLKPGLVMYLDDEKRTSASWTFPSSPLPNCPHTNLDVVVDCADPPAIGQSRSCTITVPINVNQQNGVHHFSLSVINSGSDLAFENAEATVVFPVAACSGATPFHTLGNIHYYDQGDTVAFRRFEFDVFFYAETTGSLGYNIVVDVTMTHSLDVIYANDSPALQLNFNEELIIMPLLAPTSYSFTSNMLCSSSTLLQNEYLACRVAIAATLPTDDNATLVLQIDGGSELTFIAIVSNNLHYCTSCSAVNFLGDVQVNNEGCGTATATVTWAGFASNYTTSVLSFDLIMRGNSVYSAASVDLTVSENIGGLSQTDTIILTNTPVSQSAISVQVVSTEWLCPAPMDTVTWFDVLLKFDVGYHHYIKLTADQTTNPSANLYKFYSIRVLNNSNGIYFVDGVHRHSNLHELTNNDNSIKVGLGRLVNINNGVPAEITIRIYGTATSNNAVNDNIDLQVAVLSEDDTPITTSAPITMSIIAGSSSPDIIDISDATVSITSPKSANVLQYGEAFTVMASVVVSESRMASISTMYGLASSPIDVAVGSELVGGEPVFAVERLHIVSVGLNLPCWPTDLNKQMTDTAVETGGTLTKRLRLNNVGVGCMQQMVEGDASVNEILIAAQLRLWPNALLTARNYTVTSDVYVGGTIVHTEQTPFMITNVDPASYLHHSRDSNDMSVFVANELRETGALALQADSSSELLLRFWMPMPTSFYIEIYNDETVLEMFKLDVPSSAVITKFFGQAVQCKDYDNLVSVFTTANNIATDVAIKYPQMTTSNNGPVTEKAEQFEFEIAVPLYLNLVCDMNDTQIMLVLSEADANATLVTFNVDTLINANPQANAVNLTLTIPPTTPTLGDTFVVMVGFTIPTTPTVPVDWFGMHVTLPPYVHLVAYNRTSLDASTLDLTQNDSSNLLFTVTGHRWSSAGTFVMMLELVVTDDFESDLSGSGPLDAVVGYTLYWEPCPQLNVVEPWPLVIGHLAETVQITLQTVASAYEMSTEASGLLSNCQFRSSSNYAASVALDARKDSGTFWSPSVYPGSNDYVEVYFGQPTSISAVVLRRDGSNAKRFPNMIVIEVLHDITIQPTTSWHRIKTHESPFDWDGDVVELSLGVAVSVFSIRVTSVDIGYDLASHQSKPVGFGIEAFKGGRPFANISFSCAPSSPPVSSHYLRRSMLALNDTHVFVCNWSPSSYYTCHTTEGVSGKWTAIDPSVHNVLGYHDGSVYGLQSDHTTIVVTRDFGQTWLPVKPADFSLVEPNLDPAHIDIPGGLKTDFDTSPISQHYWNAKFEGLYFMDEVYPRFTWTEFCA